jgi:MraZ protein
MYVGEFNHNIDAKGRVIFPAEYRESLGDKVYITLGFDGCLVAYDEPTWREMEERLSDLSVADPKIRMLQRSLLSKVQEASFDKQGRVLLRENLRKFAGLTKDVTVAGVGKRIEIWDTERWNEFHFDDLDEIANQLGDLGIKL